MRPLLIIAFFLSLITPIARAQKKSPVRFPPPVLGINDPEFINACELTDHIHELVYTRFAYSGVDEYWRLSPIDKKCKDFDGNTDLEVPDSVYLKPQNLKLLKYVHEHYWNSYLIIDAIGFFDNSNKNGYGHLGSNTSQFTVQKFVNIQKAKTKKQ
jgi:hypothetical protein